MTLTIIANAHNQPNQNVIKSFSPVVHGAIDEGGLQVQAQHLTSCSPLSPHPW